MKDPYEKALGSEIADSSELTNLTGNEVQAVKPRAVVASQSDFQ